MRRENALDRKSVKPSKTHGDYAPWHNLAVAIVERAILDYGNNYQKKLKGKIYSKKDMIEAEKFLTSERCAIFLGIGTSIDFDGEDFVKRIQMKCQKNIENGISFTSSMKGAA